MAIKHKTSDAPKPPDVAMLVVLSVCWMLLYVSSVWLSMKTSEGYLVWAGVLLVWMTLFSAVIISAFEPYKLLKGYTPEEAPWRWKLGAIIRLYLASVMGFPALACWLVMRTQSPR